jgi:hypothetical protein
MCGGRYHGAARNGTLQQKLAEDGDRFMAICRQRAAEQGFVLDQEETLFERNIA